MRRINNVNKKIKKINKNGFSLLETVLTIIIIGLAMGAIVESFLTGSAKSVNIVNEETAVNVAKGITAALNYCRNEEGTTPTPQGVPGVCSAFASTTWSNPSGSLNTPSPLVQPMPQSPLPPNECFYTTITASKVDFNDTNGSGIIANGSSGMYIQAIVQTGWLAPSGGSCPATAPAGCPGTPGSCPSVTVSTIFANY